MRHYNHQHPCSGPSRFPNSSCTASHTMIVFLSSYKVCTRHLFLCVHNASRERTAPQYIVSNGGVQTMAASLQVLLKAVRLFHSCIAVVAHSLIAHPALLIRQADRLSCIPPQGRRAHCGSRTQGERKHGMSEEEELCPALIHHHLSPSPHSRL